MGSQKTKAELIAENEELREGHRLLKFALETVPHLVTVKDSKGRFLLVSRAWCATYNLTPKEVIGKSPLEIPARPTLDLQAIVHEDQQVLSGKKKATKFEATRTVGTGEERLFAITKTGITNEKGTLVGSIAIGTDITDLKLAEDQLRRSEGKYRTLIEHASDGIFITDEKGNFLEVNLRGCELFGFLQGELLHLNVRDFVPPEEMANFQKHNLQLDGGEFLIFERQIPRKDGSRFPAEISAKKLADGTTLSIVRDITERRRVEDALRDSERKFQQLYDNAPDMFVSVDAKTGNVINCNQTFALNIGYTIEEILGQHVSKFYHPDSEEDRKNVFQQFVNWGVVNDAELQLQRNNGSVIEISLNISAVRDAQGNILYSNSVARDITERKRAEEVRKKIEDRYRMLYDYTPIMLHSIDRGGYISQVNRFWLETMGYALDEVIGRKSIEFLTEDSQKFAVEEGLPNFFLSGQAKDVPYQFVKKNGEIIDIMLSAQAEYDEQGNIIGTFANLENITQLKKIVKELRAGQRLLQTVFDTIPHWLFVKDRESKYLMVNSAYAESFDRNPDDFKGVEARDIMKRPEEEFKQLMETDNQVWETGERVDIPKINTTLSTGARRTHSAIKLPLLDDAGNIIGVVGVSEDITERKQAEAALRESKALLDSYFNVAPAGMALFDSELRYVKLNRTLADINGLSIEDHLHKRPREILPGTLGIAVEERFENLLRTGQPIVNEEISGETLSQPGVTRHWMHSFFPIFGVEQTAKGIGVILLEITKIKSMEEQLRQSQKMEALGTLAGGIAHDFNNILYPIIGFSELLLEKLEAGSEEYSYLTMIAESAHRAADLVSQILLFSRRNQTEKSVCDLVPVAKEVTKLMRSTLPITIAIETKISKDLALVFCDPSQIHQVLLNLCVNAGQAILGIGEIKIALEALELEGFESFDGKKLSGKHVRLAVTDNGVGMDRETLGHIFEPFFTTKAVGEGTGLGLSTVFGIVHDHGGGIAVSSEPGKGTTFEVFLPLAEGNIKKATDTLDPKYHGTGNILFVDDEETITRLGRISLERLGYIVTAVSDGERALEVFAENPERFNLVVTDQTMPNMTGETLVRELLKLRPDIPIILCTGHSESISLKRSNAIGISSFLYKPIAPRELGRVVREVLHQAKEVSPRA